MLTNALANFVSQTGLTERGHDARLFVLDDAQQFDEQSHETWELLVAPERFQSLPSKLNALVRIAKAAGFDAVALWEDDDVYLPHHLAYHAAQLEQFRWSIPRKKYVDCHRRPGVKPQDLQLLDLRCETRDSPWCHGSWAFSIDLWEQVGGYDETKTAGFDLDFARRCEDAAGTPGDYTNVMLCQEPQYCYRWGSFGYPNGTALEGNYYESAKRTGDGERVRGEVEPEFDVGTKRIRELLGHDKTTIAHRPASETKRNTTRHTDRVPIFITNRDRIGWVRAAVRDLKRLPGAEVFIVDNASTYPPLLEWYETQDECRVFRLTENRGPRAAWSIKDEVIGDSKYYVVTDNDLDVSTLPADTLEVLATWLDQLPNIHKAGLALRIDDLPATANGRAAKEAEAKYWEPARRLPSAMGREVYDAALDTTFAMYRQTPAYLGQYEPAARLAGPYTVRHLPWYQTPETLNEDDRWYLANANFAGLFYSPRQWQETQQADAAKPHVERSSLADVVRDAIAHCEAHTPSRLAPDVLALEGMSSPKVRHLLNRLVGHRPSLRYFEAGSFRGSTFCSAMYGNDTAHGLACDNWSQFGGQRDEFVANCERLLGRSPRFIESDFMSITAAQVEQRLGGKIDVYFYDGGHTETLHREAITRIWPALSDECIVLIDDYNWDFVRKATVEGLSLVPEHEVLFAEFLPANHGGEGDVANWWNGLFVAAIRKRG